MAKSDIRQDGSDSRVSAPTLRRDAVFQGVDSDDLDRLLALRHPDPHSILGIHQTRRGVVVRAYRPGADSVTVIADDGTRYLMTSRGDGLFDLLIESRREIFKYRIEVTYPGNRVFILRQPYAFLPTVGDFDVHLFAEGTYERAWDRLGARECEVEGVRGVAFSVWAPNAAGVSVVGDFNSWDGRLHLMRALGSSGIWELFVPELTPGTRYKYEIRGREGPVPLKTDPFATATEIPPRTAAVVSHHAVAETDAGWRAARAARDPFRSPISIYEMHLASWRRVP